MQFPRGSRGRQPLLGYVLLALVLTPLLLILACGEDKTPTTTATTQAQSTPTLNPTATATPLPTPTATATMPKQPVTSRLRVAIGIPGTQSTMTHMLQSNESLILPEYERLVGHEPTTGVEGPQLAESWSVAANGRDWTWKLRKNVPFYKNGKPTGFTFTAKDLILSWQLREGDPTLVATPHVQSGQWAGRLGSPNAWKVINDYQVAMTTPSINLDLSLHLSDELAAGIVSKDHWDKVGGEKGYFDDPVGTGPFTINKYTINQGIIHDRVENHWRKTPDFPQLEWIYVKEDSTKLAMLLAGEAQVTQIPRVLNK